MQSWARKIYFSARWTRARELVLMRDNGLCVMCGKPGDTVHHIVPLTADNCTDPLVAFGEGNLETLCRDCHAAIHNNNLATGDGMKFDDEGNLVATTPPIPSDGREGSTTKTNSR